jgi:excisionase family DNA binding protein
MACSCPDGVGMCKHTAAVLYGIGASLDLQPEWLFKLRHVDHVELIVQASADGIIAPSKPSADSLEESDLSSLFGIEMAEMPSPVKETVQSTPKQSVPASVEEDIELSVPQAAVLLKISKSHLLRLLDDKVIAFRKEGKQCWIAFEEIIKYRKSR